MSFIDPDGVVTTLTYSPRGWLQRKTVGNAVTRYRHDAAGQLVQVTNPDGSTVAYTHDAAHRLTDIADGLGNRIHFTLDAAGGRIGQILYNSSGVAVSGHSAVFDTLLEADDDGFAGSGEPVSVGLPDPSAQAQQHLARQLTQILRNLRDRITANSSDEDSPSPTTDGNDPDSTKNLTPINPAKDCDGNCKPCPPNQYWSHPGDAHGSTTGIHYHDIIWNQNPKTCVCYSNRVSGPTPNNLR